MSFHRRSSAFIGGLFVFSHVPTVAALIGAVRVRPEPRPGYPLGPERFPGRRFTLLERYTCSDACIIAPFPGACPGTDASRHGPFGPHTRQGPGGRDRACEEGGRVTRQEVHGGSDYPSQTGGSQHPSRADASPPAGATAPKAATAGTAGAGRSAAGRGAAAAPKPAAVLAAPAPLTTDDDKTVYAIGISIGQSLSMFNLTPSEIEL